MIDPLTEELIPLKDCHGKLPHARRYDAMHDYAVKGFKGVAGKLVFLETLWLPRTGRCTTANAWRRFLHELNERYGEGAMR